MSEIKTGGFVFPRGDDYPWDEGMTLRDWFAGQALSRMSSELWPSGEGFEETNRILVKRCSAWAYQYADAMIAEREPHG